MHCQATSGAVPHDDPLACSPSRVSRRHLSTSSKDVRPLIPIETRCSSFRSGCLLHSQSRTIMCRNVHIYWQLSGLCALLGTSRLATGGLRPWLVLKPLCIDGPCAIEQVAVLLGQDLFLHGVEKPLESQQVPGPLVCPALQAGHDGAIHHGQKLYVVCTDAKSTQGIQAVDHVDRVATGADHAAKVVLVLGEVVDVEAAPLDLPLHVGDDVCDSTLGDDAVHGVREEDDVSDDCAVFVVGDDVGYVCLQDVESTEQRCRERSRQVEVGLK